MGESQKRPFELYQADVTFRSDIELFVLSAAKGSPSPQESLKQRLKLFYKLRHVNSIQRQVFRYTNNNYIDTPQLFRNIDNEINVDLENPPIPDETINKSHPLQQIPIAIGWSPKRKAVMEEIDGKEELKKKAVVRNFVEVIQQPVIPDNYKKPKFETLIYTQGESITAITQKPIWDDGFMREKPFRDQVAKKETFNPLKSDMPPDAVASLRLAGTRIFIPLPDILKTEPGLDGVSKNGQAKTYFFVEPPAFIGTVTDGTPTDYITIECDYLHIWEQYVQLPPKFRIEEFGPGVIQEFFFSPASEQVNKEKDHGNIVYDVKEKWYRVSPVGDHSSDFPRTKWIVTETTWSEITPFNGTDSVKISEQSALHQQIIDLITESKTNVNEWAQVYGACIRDGFSSIEGRIFRVVLYNFFVWLGRSQLRAIYSGNNPGVTYEEFHKLEKLREKELEVEVVEDEENNEKDTEKDKQKSQQKQKEKEKKEKEEKEKKKNNKSDSENENENENENDTPELSHDNYKETKPDNWSNAFVTKEFLADFSKCGKHDNKFKGNEHRPAYVMEEKTAKHHPKVTAEALSRQIKLVTKGMDDEEKEDIPYKEKWTNDGWETNKVNKFNVVPNWAQ